MNKFFAPDNKFARGFTTLIDILIIGVLWLFCSIPVFTIGTSTAAMYYAIHKVIFQGRGYAYKEFFRGFKDNFKQGVAVTLMLVVFNGLMFYLFDSTSSISPDRPISWNIIFVIFMAFSIIWGLMMFAFMSRFANTLKAHIKNVSLIVVMNIPVALIGFIAFILLLIVAFYITKLFIFLPGFLGVILHQLYEKVFRKYMSEEDKALEDERML